MLVYLIFKTILATIFDIYFESLSNNLLASGINMVFSWWSRFEPTCDKKLIYSSCNEPVPKNYALNRHFRLAELICIFYHSSFHFKIWKNGNQFFMLKYLLGIKPRYLCKIVYKVFPTHPYVGQVYKYSSYSYYGNS